MSNSKKIYSFFEVPFNSLEWTLLISRVGSYLKSVDLSKPFDENQVCSLRLYLAMITHPTVISRMQSFTNTEYQNTIKGFFIKQLGQIYNSSIILCLNNLAAILKNKATYPSYKSFLLSPQSQQAVTNQMRNPYLQLQQEGFFSMIQNIQDSFNTENYTVNLDPYYVDFFDPSKSLFGDKLQTSLNNIMSEQVIDFQMIRSKTSKLNASKFYISQDLPEQNESLNLQLTNSTLQQDFDNALKKTSFDNVLIIPKQRESSQKSKNSIQLKSPPQILPQQQQSKISSPLAQLNQSQTSLKINRPNSPTTRKIINMTFNQKPGLQVTSNKKIFENNLFGQQTTLLNDSKLNQSSNQSLTNNHTIQKKPPPLNQKSSGNPHNQDQPNDKPIDNYHKLNVNFYSDTMLHYMVIMNQNPLQFPQLICSPKSIFHPFSQVDPHINTLISKPIINNNNNNQERISIINLQNKIGKKQYPYPKMSNFFDDSDLPASDPSPSVPDDIQKSMKNIEIITKITDSPFAKVDISSFNKLTQGYFLTAQFQQSNSTQKLSLQSILSQMKSVYSGSLTTFEFSQLAESLLKYPLAQTNNEIVREFVYTHYLMQHAINFCFLSGTNGSNPQISELLDADLSSPTLRSYLENLIEKIHDQIITKRLKAFLEFSFVQPQKEADLTISQVRSDKGSLPQPPNESQKLKNEVQSYLTPLAEKYKTFNSVEQKLADPVAGCMAFYFEKTQDERFQLIDSCQIVFTSYIQLMKKLKDVVSLYVEKFAKIAITDQFGIKRGVPLNRANYDTIRQKKDGSWEFVVVNAAATELEDNYVAWNYLYKFLIDAADTHLSITLLLQIQLIEQFASDENSALVFAKLVLGPETTAQDIKNLKNLLQDSMKKTTSALFMQNTSVQAFQGQVCQLIQIQPDRFKSILNLSLNHTDLFLNKDGSFKQGKTQEHLCQSTRTGANVSNISIGLVNAIIKLIESYYQMPLTKGSQGEKEQQVLNLLKMNSPFTPESQYSFFTIVQSNSPLSADVSKLKSQLQGNPGTQDLDIVGLKTYLKQVEEKRKKVQGSDPTIPNNLEGFFSSILKSVVEVVSQM